MPLNHSFQNCKPFLNRYHREIATWTWPKMNTFMWFAADWKYPVTSFPVKMLNTIKGYAVVNFEIASSSSLWDIHKNHFVRAVEAADIDDSIKWKRIWVFLKNHHEKNTHENCQSVGPLCDLCNSSRSGQSTQHWRLCFYTCGYGS